MTSFGVFSPEDAREIHRKVLGQQSTSSPENIQRRYTTSADMYYVKMLADLPAATNPETGYTQADGLIVRYKIPAEDTLDREVAPDTAENREKITNRSTSFSANTGDYIWVKRAGSEYIPLHSSGGTSTPIIRFEIFESDCEGRSAIVRVLSNNGSVPGSYEIYGEIEQDEQGQDVPSKFVVVYDKTGCFLNESNINLQDRIGYATYLTGRPKYPYQPWTGFEVTSLAEQQTECEAF